MNNEITIRDIAKMCNVSVSTVSRVINNQKRVSEETRKKVLKIIKDLNYVPNNAAVTMVKKETKIIAVIVPEIINSFYTAVIQGTEEYARNNGYFTLVFSTDDDKSKEKDFFNGILSKIVDGIIIVPSDQNVEHYKKFSKPIVLVDRYIDNCGYDGVVIDNLGGAYQATKHMIDYGHKNIAIINGPMDFNTGKERFEGYKMALRDYNIDTVPDYIMQGDWFEGNGYKSTLKLIEMKNPPDAIFASNNLICEGCIKALWDRNIRIGKDISLVGFDDNQLADFVNPKVTIIRRSTSEMGKVATQMLLEKILKNNINMAHKKITLGTELIQRGSVVKIH